MKRLLLAPIFLFLLGGCGFILDNEYTVKFKNGSTLVIKESNTTCTKQSGTTFWRRGFGNTSGLITSPSTYRQDYRCTANGVITDLVGYQRVYNSTNEICRKNSASILCKAGAYFNMIDEDYFFTKKVENRCYRADGSKKLENFILKSYWRSEKCFVNKADEADA